VDLSIVRSGYKPKNTTSGVLLAGMIEAYVGCVGF
jgi:hypothetical protein